MVAVGRIARQRTALANNLFHNLVPSVDSA
jgi:hypothetical protein